MMVFGNVQAFMRLTGERLKPDYAIAGFPEYATSITSLDSDQRMVIQTIALRTVQSLVSRTPVRAILIIGNADVALRKPIGQRAAFEGEVSLQRAQAAEQALLGQIAQRAGSPNGIYLVRTRAIGVGSTNRAVINAATEAQMRKNRRVEFVLFHEQAGQPKCACNTQELGVA